MLFLGWVLACGDKDDDPTPDGDADSEADADTDSDSDGDSDADGDTDGDTDGDADTDADGDADTDTDTDTDPFGFWADVSIDGTTTSVECLPDEVGDWETVYQNVGIINLSLYCTDRDVAPLLTVQINWMKGTTGSAKSTGADNGIVLVDKKGGWEFAGGAIPGEDVDSYSLVVDQYDEESDASITMSGSFDALGTSSKFGGPAHAVDILGSFHVNVPCDKGC